MSHKYEIDRFSEKEVQALAADLSKENDYITETAGFIPLEVKLKQFEQNGLIAQFENKEFTSHDYREMYLNPDFDITPEDEIEDIQEKLQALKNYQEDYKAKKIAKSNGVNEPPSAAEAGTEEHEKATQTEKAE